MTDRRVGERPSGGSCSPPWWSWQSSSPPPGSTWNGSTGVREIARAGGFNFNIVPTKHPVPDARFYCGGIGWFSVALPDPPLIAAEVNAAPTTAAHGAALKFYNDLVNGRSTTSDLATVSTAYACPIGG